MRKNFYSRPCGRGDVIILACLFAPWWNISTHAPAGGATTASVPASPIISSHFYSRPCGRGDSIVPLSLSLASLFLLTPLREGRQAPQLRSCVALFISTHAPAGGATVRHPRHRREGHDFYSRPCGRGDLLNSHQNSIDLLFLLTPLREGRPAMPV